MLVILQLRGEANQPLPQFSVSVGLLLGVASFAMLIYFINHVAVSIQASVVVAEVSDELRVAIDREFPDPFHTETVSSLGETTGEEPADLMASPHTVITTASGYIQVRDDEGLLRFAQKYGLILNLLKQPGDFVTEFTSLALVWPKDAASSEMDETINAAFILGAQRTLVQDVTFGINSLVEVAIRALSPAINDPFTAMTCLDWLGTSLCRICTRTLPSARLYDNKGHLRLITNPITFTGLADAAFSQIRDYGRSSTMVMLRMLDTIATVAQCVRTEEQRTTMLRHATLVERSCYIGLPETADREVVIERYQAVLRLLEKSQQEEL
jgi:uncharacterized membrane protein